LIVTTKFANEIDRFGPSSEEAVGPQIDGSTGEVRRRE
jgi:hypothetical protein